MDLAVNYSAAMADLVARGLAEVDRYKCPAWPDLVSKITGDVPLYVHCPLRVGAGTGTPIDTEKNTSPDWGAMEAMLIATDTPWFSAHMGPQPDDHPDLSGATWDTQVAVITEALIRDIQGMTDRFGPDRVVGENIFEYHGMHLRPAVLPEVLCDVVEATGCGLLLDLSHARLAARDLGVDPKAYIEALPLSHLREIHVTGIQRFDGRWVEMLERAAFPEEDIDRYRGELIDHLPMVDGDWDFLAWVLDRIRSGAWPEPEIIAYEYGGVGREFEAMTVQSELAAQVPRMYAMVHESSR